MDEPDNREILNEILATNRELAAVNRQIAASLANLEHLYAADVRQRNEFSQQSMRRIRKMGKMPSSLSFYIPVLAFVVIMGAVFVVPKLIDKFLK